MSRPLPGARFSDPAQLYDLVYQFKDYAGDADKLADILAARGVTHGATLLEGACGTGSYLAPLAARYRVAGFDIDPRMLEIARSKVGPGANLYRADLVDFQPPDGVPVDALLMLFGAIGYVAPGQLDGAIAAMARAVRPGGVLLLEPWVSEDRFQEQVPWMLTWETPFLKICRQCVPVREGQLSVVDFHYLVSRPGFQPEHVVDYNALWMHDHDALARRLEAGGFSVERTDHGFMEDRVLMECVRR